MEFLWIKEIMPILIFLIAFILCYAGLQKIKLPGSNWVLALLSFLISLLLVSSINSTNYLGGVISIASVLLIVSFFLMLLVIFVAKDLEIFKTPLSWAIFIIGAMLVLILTFNNFPNLYHMLPGTSDSSLTDELSELKDFIYSQKFIQNFVFTAAAIAIAFVVIKK